MNAPAGLDLASLPERIQSEVQRAIQRSIKGVEYIASSGPSLGSTPKDILNVRGTMNLYRYRPVADEIYRVPILIVMATTNRGYILDLVPGQSFVEFLLRRGRKTLDPEDRLDRQGRGDPQGRPCQPGGRRQRHQAAVAETRFMARREIDMSGSDIRSYPRRVLTDAGEIEFRLMSRADEAAVLDFARKLPVHDLLFLPRDISEPKVLAAWIKEIERGAITSLLAVRAGRVVGCGTLVRDPLSWSPHVGEIRNVVASDVRGQGVGRALSQETFALALGAGLEKLVVQMTVDQTGAIAIFEGLGFKAEALLRDQVKDKAGKKHDIVVLGHNVAQVRAQMEAYGLPGAVQH